MFRRYKVQLISVVAVATLFFGASCSKAPVMQEKAAVNQQSTRLAVIPANLESNEYFISEDGRHLAYVVRQGDEAFLILDSKEIGRHKEISHIVFSPDCRSVAYKTTDQGKQAVAINGTAGKSWERIGTVQFAPDGRVVYEAFANGKWRIVSGKRESPEFDFPLDMPLISVDGTAMAYVEKHRDRKKGNLVVCSLDMKLRMTGREYDDIVRISGDRAVSRLAFIANQEGKQRVVSVVLSAKKQVQESEGPLFDQILTLDVSADGAHLAYLARRDKTVLLVKNGVELPFPEHEMRSQTLISRNGRSFNAGSILGAFFPVMDGKRFGDTYDGIRDPVFSADGSQFAFVARTGDKHYVVANGSPGPRYDMVVGPQFSPDNSRLVYRARQDGKRFVVVADARGKTVKEQPTYEMVWQPAFTPDGKSIAYTVKSARELWWRVESLN